MSKKRRFIKPTIRRNQTIYDKFRSKTQMALFFIFAIVLLFLILETFGIVSPWTWATSNNSKQTAPRSQSATYALQWQNQNGAPFTWGNMSGYQWINIDLSLVSDSNFAQETDIVLKAYGTMSQSLSNNSLAYIRVVYDGAVPYLGNESAYAGSYGLDLTVVRNGTVPMDYAIGPTISLLAAPTHITWKFPSGPHYPTLQFHYWNGHEITKTFESAPVIIQAQQPAPPILPIHDTPEQIGVSWTIGGAAIFIVQAAYLMFPRKPRSSTS